MSIAFLALLMVQTGPDAGPHSGRPDDRGYRQAERALAAVTEIRIPQSRYLRRITEDARSIFDESVSPGCMQSELCNYHRSFPIRVGPRTIARLLFSLNHLDTAQTICGDRGRQHCRVSVSVYAAGDETPPHCVRVEPIRRAAARHGWRLYPYRDSDHPDAERYRHRDDAEIYLHIRTLADRRCFSSLNVMRIPAAPSPVR